MAISPDVSGGNVALLIGDLEFVLSNLRCEDPGKTHGIFGHAACAGAPAAGLKLHHTLGHYFQHLEPKLEELGIDGFPVVKYLSTEIVERREKLERLKEMERRG